MRYLIGRSAAGVPKACAAEADFVEPARMRWSCAGGVGVVELISGHSLGHELLRHQPGITFL